MLRAEVFYRTIRCVTCCKVQELLVMPRRF